MKQIERAKIAVEEGEETCNPALERWCTGIIRQPKSTAESICEFLTMLPRLRLFDLIVLKRHLTETYGTELETEIRVPLRKVQTQTGELLQSLGMTPTNAEEAKRLLIKQMEYHLTCSIDKKAVHAIPSMRGLLLIIARPTSA